MKYKVFVKNFVQDLIIGIHPHEKEHPQRILIDVTVKLEYKKFEDNLDRVYDYEHLTKLIAKKLSTKKFELLETLADFLIDLIKEDKRVKKVQIKVSKPDILGSERVGVELSSQ